MMLERVLATLAMVVLFWAVVATMTEADYVLWVGR